jgi:hypothetical protein
MSAAGAAPETVLDLPTETIQMLRLGAWGLTTAFVTAAVGAVILGLRNDSEKPAE